MSVENKKDKRNGEETKEGEIKDKKESTENSKKQRYIDSNKSRRKDSIKPEKEESKIKEKEGSKKEREESKLKVREEKDDGRSRKRRYTHSSSDSDDDKDGKERVKRSRRSEPSRKYESSSSTKVERRHFYSRRSNPPPLPKVDLAKLAAGEYPIHKIPTKWNLSFDSKELTEIETIKKSKPKIRMQSPQPIPISESSETESSSSSPTKAVRTVIGNFWRVKPPFPRAKTIIATDGTCLSLFFTDKYVFSNHFPADFTVNGIAYSCSEQYYMRFKAVYFGDAEIAESIMQTSDPKEMKRYGRQVEGFDEEKWKNVSLQVMKIACYNKFTQNKILRYELFRTIDTTLVEASPMDRYWGVGLSMDNENIRNPSKWRGENLLGYILTKLRDHLKKQPVYEEEIKQVYTEFDPSVV
uniref:NADAR domain-containing protein n=1 Tax=Panagrolaimus davidi TaxID=227884 RepID=A0A914QET9_9BILA